jgi:hypothetical protein
MRERLFKEMLFCGTPEVYFMGLGKLHAQVARALGLISGLQQPPHSTSETEARMDEYERELGWKEVMVCVQDIVCALLGPDYYIEKKIPESECCRMEHDIEDDRDLGLMDIVVWGLREAEKAIEGEDEYLDQPEDERFFMASKRITDALDAAQNLRGKKEIDPYSLFAPHTCNYDKCKARAKYITHDGFGRRLLVCEEHYSKPTCDQHFSHCPPGRTR